MLFNFWLKTRTVNGETCHLVYDAKQFASMVLEMTCKHPSSF